VRNLLALLAAAALTFVGLGWYLGWYSIRPTPADAGHRSVTIDVDARKVDADIRRGLREGEDRLYRVLQETAREDTGRSDTARTPAGKKTAH
jgi:hypothetical protein